MLFHLLALLIALVGSFLGRVGVPLLCLLALALVVVAHEINSYWTFFSREFIYHFNPISHVHSYLIGFFVGYCWTTDRAGISSLLSGKRALFGWLQFIALLILESYLNFYGRYDGLSRGTVALMEHIERLILPLLTIWTIIACASGHGGWINKLLSCKLFIVLGRISFIIYLTHFLVVNASAGLTEPAHWQRQPMLSFLVIGTMIVSIMVATTVCILFEQPWLQMHKQIMKYLR